MIMEYDFTPAVCRTLGEAARWSPRNGSDLIEPVSILFGLLAEPECRAALMLARAGINAEVVRRRWPDFQRAERPLGQTADPSRPRRFSPQTKASLAAASERLADYPQPLELATEHLLLGLAAADHEVSVWLRDHGVAPDRLEAEIHRFYHHTAKTVPIDWDQPLPADLGDEPSLSPTQNQLDAPIEMPIDLEPAPELSPEQEAQATRVIDAGANRALEAIRVVEDYVRFAMDDRHLTEHCKRLRHDLAAALAPVTQDRCLAARDTQADVGTDLATGSESVRHTMADVLAANFKRLQEALRSLEEFGKLLHPEMAAQLEQLRYRVYTLHRAAELTRTSADRLAQTRLYVLVDGCLSLSEFDALVGALLEAGVHAIQLRDKGLDDRSLLARARRLRELTQGSQTLFIMNDRPDLAALSHADGVHLGQEELTVKDARRIVGLDALVGVSTHSIEQARAAVLEGANYLGVGPTFRSPTKQFEQLPGLDLLRAVAAEIRLPAFAIGGITLENLPQVLQTGVQRIAVSSAILHADNPADVAHQLLAALTPSPPSSQSSIPNP